MIKIARIVSVLLVLLILSMLLTSCVQGETEYTGDYPELFSVALGSTLGTRGYRIVGGLRGVEQPGVSILEEDDFGRVLFLYGENEIFRSREAAGRTITTIINEHIYMVAQKIDGDYVYFYPHYNFVIRRQEVRSAIESYFDDIPALSADDLDTLKEANSWNQELSDDSAFEKVRIVRQKEGGPLSSNQLADARLEIFPDLEVGRRMAARGMNFLRTDRYGRSVYSTWGNGTFVAIVFQPDQSFNVEIGVLEITDMFNYQTELRLFMEANGWNTPWVEP